MRYKIFEKDDFFLIGGERVDMDADVVEFGHSMPLVTNFDFSSIPAHMAIISDIRLEDGDITGEVGWSNETKMNDEAFAEIPIRLGGYYLGVEKTEDGTRVTKAVLKGASIMALSDTPGWPKVSS